MKTIDIWKCCGKSILLDLLVYEVTMFHKKDQDKRQEFLNQTKLAREERAEEKKKETSVIFVQKYVRGFLARNRLRRDVLKQFDDNFDKYNFQLEEVGELPVGKYQYK